MRFDWRSLGIDTKGRYSGNLKSRCPKCSSDRHKRRDPCLSVDLDRGLYNCHHCGYSGRASSEDYMAIFKPVKKTYNKPKYAPGAEPQDKLVGWFQTRAISEAVIRRNRIEARAIHMPDTGKEERAIAFPYFRDGEIVNVQYRTPDKRFRLETGCELILYGLDDIQASEPLIWVEGQIDKLSLEEAGYLACVSAPNGANLGDAAWLTNAQAKLDGVKYHVLAGDNDEKGRAFQDELARRLGPERCWRVEWPAGCKDANDTLVKFGKAGVIEAIECAAPLPIHGVVEMTDLAQEIEDLYRSGIQSGEHPGWPNLAELYRPRAGEWTLITGAPGMGKSGFLDAMMTNLALNNDWRFALFSPEQAPLKRHAVQLLELWSGQPFSQGKPDRMSLGTAKEGMTTLRDYFKFFQPEECDLTVEGILSLARACVTRYGIRGLVIDPWNELEHGRPQYMTETEYIGQSLSKIRRFARLYDLHVWVLVHPTKLQKKADGTYPVASPYDCMGSSHWFNKADMVLSVWRDKTNAGAPTEIHVQKVRFRENGQLGVANLYYDWQSGRLSDTPNTYRNPGQYQEESE